MQGTAADIIKRAMIAVDAWLQSLDGHARMIMQVHDELVFEVREDRIEKISPGCASAWPARRNLPCR
jgi:DNA polymerase-1